MRIVDDEVMGPLLLLGAIILGALAGIGIEREIVDGVGDGWNRAVEVCRNPNLESACVPYDERPERVK